MPQPLCSPSSDWFKEWFNHPFYLQVYRHRDQAEALHCVTTILQQTIVAQKVPSTIAVLDIACGAGRHAVEFARRGYQVTANDLSPFLLEEAKKAAQEQHVMLQLSCYDMRYLPLTAKYDLIVQLFTSFGYFECHDDDQAVLNNAAQLLKNDGWYVLDLLNPIVLANTLIPTSERSVGELLVHEQRTLSNNKVTKTISITSPTGETVHFTESVQLYDEKEIREMLERAGLFVKHIIGNYHGEPFAALHSPRMMLFCQKG